jgi:glucose-6-phosphate 1-dehydrogenase
MKPKPRPADPCILVIFGAAGDLTRRLLVPALENLRRAGLLPKEFAVIGIARRELDNEAFRRELGLREESDNGKPTSAGSPSASTTCVANSTIRRRSQISQTS